MRLIHSGRLSCGETGPEEFFPDATDAGSVVVEHDRDFFKLSGCSRRE